MTIFQDLLSLLLANACAGCGETLSAQERNVCVRCLADLQLTEHWHSPQDNVLYHRFGGKFSLSGATGLCYFDKDNHIQTILHTLKYKNSPMLGMRLGEVFGDILAATPWAKSIEAVVPVPLYRKKQRERGYNQAEEIAKGVAKQLHIPVANDVVRRIRATETQAQKVGIERWHNVSDAFALERQPPTCILLLDDVITTGSTIEACAHALQSADTDIYIGSIAVVR